MHNNPSRGVNGQGCRIHNAVVGFDKLNAELPQVNGLPEFDHLPLGVVCKVVLFQLIFNDPHSKLGGINRDINVPQHVGQRANMILMAMGNHKALYFFNVIL